MTERNRYVCNTIRLLIAHTAGLSIPHSCFRFQPQPVALFDAAGAVSTRRLKPDTTILRMSRRLLECRTD